MKMPGTPLDTQERTGAPGVRTRDQTDAGLAKGSRDGKQMLHKLERTHGDVGHEMAGIGRNQLRGKTCMQTEGGLTHPSHLAAETRGISLQFRGLHRAQRCG